MSKLNTIVFRFIVLAGVFENRAAMKTAISTVILLFVISISSSSFAQSPVLQEVAGLQTSQGKVQIVLSAVNKNVCWGCDFQNNKFIRTTDGGANWTVSTVINDNNLVCEKISAINTDTAFIVFGNAPFAGANADTNKGIYKTIDGGQTWTRYANAYNNSSSAPIQIYFFNSNHGVSVGQPVNGNWEIYTTSNGGTDWTRVPSANIPKPSSGEIAIEGFPGSAHGADNSFWFTTLGGGGSLYGTSNLGKTWFATRNFGAGSVAFKDSLNGVHCIPLNGGRNVSTTSDGGHTWQSVEISFTSPSTLGAAFIKGTGNSYLMCSSYSKRFPNEPTNPGTAYSSDGGRTWKVIDKLPNQWPSFAPDGTGWSAGTDNLVYKWTMFSERKIVPIKSYIDRAYVVKNADSVLFRATFLNLNNRHFTANLIYTNLENKQTDSLALYDDGLHGDLQPNDGVYGVYIPPINVEDYFKLNASTTEDSTNNYVNTPISQYRFTTVGPIKVDSLSVSKVSSTVYNVRPFFSNEGSSFTVNNLKVKISTPDISVKIGTDTVSISSIAPGETAGTKDDVNITVDSRHFRGTFKFYFDIMSDGWTYWRDTTSQLVTGIDERISKPINYTLSQNYPNPFNPTTTIDYSIPKAEHVTIKVYDVLGRLVQTLVDKQLPGGIYKAKFNGSSLSSGIYFYQLKAGNFIQAKKMIVLK